MWIEVKCVLKKRFRCWDIGDRRKKDIGGGGGVGGGGGRGNGTKKKCRIQLVKHAG